MARTNFRQQDVTRAIKGAQAAGFEVASGEIDPTTGRIIVRSASDADQDTTSPLDKWMKEDARKSERG